LQAGEAAAIDSREKGIPGIGALVIAVAGGKIHCDPKRPGQWVAVGVVSGEQFAVGDTTEIEPPLADLVSGIETIDNDITAGR